MRTIRKKVESFIIQTTYKLPNKSMKHVHHVASAPQQLFRRHCTRTMCLIQCINFYVNYIVLRSLFGRRATHFRLADCRSSGTFLTFKMFYNYENVRMSSPHSSVETRMPWLDCAVSAQLWINRVLVLTPLTYLIAYPTNIFIYQYNDNLRKNNNKNHTPNSDFRHSGR